MVMLAVEITRFSGKLNEMEQMVEKQAAPVTAPGEDDRCVN
jgi:hypothetical protein